MWFDRHKTVRLTQLFYLRSRCMSELGRLYGLSGQYERAIAIYQDMAYSALESRSATNIRILLRAAYNKCPVVQVVEVLC